MRCLSPWVATRVSGETRRGRKRIMVRVAMRTMVMVVIALFISFRWAGNSEKKTIGVISVRKNAKGKEFFTSSVAASL